jgi:hypothetical protein
VHHPEPRLLDEPRRGLVLPRRTASHPPGHLHQRPRPHTKIRAYIDGWNDRATPFTWTKTADQILAKANRKKISNAEH